MHYSLAELEQIMDDGYAEVECPECGYAACIEPDADDLCPECGEGRITSPLVKEGLI
jgi:rubrerythrin